MKAWLLDRLGGALELKDAPIPQPRPGGVVVRIEASVAGGVSARRERCAGHTGR